MMGELLIRPSLNDHEVVADLLAPGRTAIMVGKQRPIASRLVIDAATAVRRPQFAEAAAGAGIPFLVDPLTHLLQGETRDDDPWAVLPFADHRAVDASAFSERLARADLVARVIDFEIEQGATAIIPPYPYVVGLDDPWLSVALDWIRLTRERLDAIGVALPIIPIFCGQLMRFGSDRAWGGGLDLFVTVSAEARVDAMALCLSPSGNGRDSYHKVWRLFDAFDHVHQSTEVPVFAWRQGIFGPALVAAGLAGYETGIGTSEQSNIRSNIGARRPPRPGTERRRGVAAGVFLEPLGKSVNPRVARLLLEHQTMKAKVMCTDVRCCPDGIASTLQHPREHAVRSRARELSTLGGLPARSWRLNHVVGKADEALTLAKQANRVLAAVGEPLRIHATGLESLSRVAEELREEDAERRGAA
jgi:hypothetical protein